MKAIAAIAAIAAGCGAVVDPDGDLLAGLPSDGAPPRAGEAVAAALESLRLRTGGDASPLVEVHWVSAPLPHETGPADGLARGCDLWMRWSTGERLPSLLIAHEASHCVRRLMTGDGDGVHADASWWASGGMVEHVRIDMAAQGF